MLRQNLLRALGVAAALLSGTTAFCQSDSLSLSSTSANPGGTVALTLALSSPAGHQPAALQWTLSYPASAVTAISATVGSASTAAGKKITCSGSAGSYMCLLAGLNNNIIQNGVVANISITLSASASTTNIGVTNAVAAAATGLAIPVTATGGVISVTSTVILSKLTCNPTSLVASAAAVCTATLNQAAPYLGSVVALTSSSAYLTVPPSVKVLGGATSITFSATAGAVTSTQSATLTASLNGSSLQVSFTLLYKLTVSSISCSPNSLASSASTTCTVTLNRTVAASGLNIGLSDNNPLVTTPSAAVVPGNSKTVTFTATAGKITTKQTATITASLGSSLQTTVLTLSTGAAQPRLSVSCDQPTIVGGLTNQCSVQLSQPAPGNGLTVSLATNDPSLLAPGSVTLPPGSHMARFALRTLPADRDRTASLVARTPDSAQQTSVTVTALRPTVACAPPDSRDANKLLCHVQLNARLGEPVNLAVSGSRNIMLPAAITTRPDQSSLTFEATAVPSATAREVSVQVQFGSQVSRDRRLLPPSSISLHAPQNVLARFGEPVDFVVSLPDQGAAPVRLAVSKLPSGANFDASAGRFTWTPGRSQQGSYDLVFTGVAAGGDSTSAHVQITVGAGAPLATALVNAATQSPDLVCSPGSVASLLGRWLDGPTPQITIDGTVAPVLSVSSTRVDFLCPQAAPGSQIHVSLQNAAGATLALTTTLQHAAPGIFTLSGSSQGLILFDQSSLAIVRGFTAPGQPAQPGDEVSIRATGLHPDASITASFGQVEAPATSVQPVPNLPGVYDIRVKVPAGAPLGDAIPVLLRTGDAGYAAVESNRVTMAIESARP